MTERRIDRSAEVREIEKTARRLAERLGGRFILNDEKVKDFSAFSGSSDQSSGEGGARTHNGPDPDTVEF